MRGYKVIGKVGVNMSFILFGGIMYILYNNYMASLPNICT
jgi:hypothetical protein